MALILLRRFGLLALSLLVASVLVFLLLRLLPGDVAQVIAGTRATPEQVERIRHELGVDRPLAEQYLSWLGGVLRGDFGTSALNGVSVSGQLGEKLTVTLPLVAGASLLAVLVGVPLGILAGSRHRSPAGHALSVAGQLGIAVPSFWVGLMLTTLVAVQWRLLPAGGFPRDGWADPAAAVRSLVLPVVTLALLQGAVLLRFARSATLEVLHADYIRTARAKGLTEGRALLRHGARNAALPVLSVLGLEFASLLLGAVVIENVFTLPGLGQMLIADVGNRDLVKVQGTVLLVTVAVLVIGFLVDLGHRLLDPRLREAR
ncbi:ABC transporter permease [Frankia sp. CNm7]|uniref:ABC transporter permease n=1 Tax=Frankia nepalensis TaxID=1836974 RepID=A0A937RFM9_9ACTN|nr:ABC transporter permease [Frankia nepalensis]MBL7498485.1 ABC transporter permease [Frankia nepalensis]MBL7509506.1 ABC transporter permease [Frankia nepalensis]MBL7518254.1 ABC transporter permease [Frankia nepalensis]MBL7629317.1 ABC transporter permease [Frankia nepalensis]